MTKISNVRKTTKFKRSIKAISPVIATLLMIAIAVVASLVVYAWVTGYIGGTTSTAGKSIQIQSFAPQGNNLLIYVQNVGQGDVALNKAGSVYVDDNLVSITNPTQSQIPITTGQTIELTVPLPAGYAQGDNIKIKVTTTDGTFMTTSGTGSSSSGGSGTQYNIVVTQGTNGVIAPGGTTTYSSGSTPSFTITPNSGYQIASITANGASVTVTTPAGQTYQFAALSAAGSLTATYSAVQVQYQITVTQGTNGVIDPATSSYASGSTPSFTITPNSGYQIASITANGGSVPVTTPVGQTYQFAALSAAGSLTATYTVVAPVLDHFAFDTISGTKTAGTAFSITIRAIDQNGNPFTSYTLTNTLTVSSGTLSPTSTTAFSAGVWTGSVTLYTTGTTITIGTTGNSKTGTSNSITVNAGSGNFGYQTIGTTSYSMSNMILGSVYTMGSQSGTATSITAYLSTSGHTRNVNAAIYTASGTFVGSATAQSVNNNGAWVTFTFSGTKPSLTAGTQYSLVLWSDNSVNFYRLSTSSYTVVYRNINYGTWPSPGGFSTDTNEYSIYCTYSIP